MKRLYKPDHKPLRKAEYAKMDTDFFSAVAEMAEAMTDQGFKMPPKMAEILKARSEIKQKFKSG